MKLVDHIWAKYDVDGGGMLDKEETRAFIKATTSGIKGGFKMDEFDQMFDEFDEDKSGYVDKTEMLGFLKKLLGKKAFNRLGGVKGTKGSPGGSSAGFNDSEEGSGMAAAFADGILDSVRDL